MEEKLELTMLKELEKEEKVVAVVVIKEEMIIMTEEIIKIEEVVKVVTSNNRVKDFNKIKIKIKKIKVMNIMRKITMKMTKLIISIDDIRNKTNCF
jgi:hypothetical protein